MRREPRIKFCRRLSARPKLFATSLGLPDKCWRNESMGSSPAEAFRDVPRPCLRARSRRRMEASLQSEHVSKWPTKKISDWNVFPKNLRIWIAILSKLESESASNLKI